MPSPDRIPICHHVKTDGVRCKNPALRGQRYCYFHHRTLGRGARQARLQNPLPLIEDANALQVAIFRIINAILEGTLEPKKANSILFALQTACLNLKRVNLSPYWRDVVVEDEDDVLPERPKPPRGVAATTSDDGDFLDKLLPAGMKEV